MVKGIIETGRKGELMVDGLNLCKYNKLKPNHDDFVYYDKKTIFPNSYKEFDVAVIKKVVSKEELEQQSCPVLRFENVYIQCTDFNGTLVSEHKEKRFSGKSFLIFDKRRSKNDLGNVEIFDFHMKIESSSKNDSYSYVFDIIEYNNNYKNRFSVIDEKKLLWSFKSVSGHASLFNIKQALLIKKNTLVRCERTKELILDGTDKRSTVQDLCEERVKNFLSKELGKNETEKVSEWEWFSKRTQCSYENSIFISINFTSMNSGKILIERVFEYSPDYDSDYYYFMFSSYEEFNKCLEGGLFGRNMEFKKISLSTYERLFYERLLGKK